MAATDAKTSDILSAPRSLDTVGVETGRGQVRAAALLKGVIFWIALGAALLFFLFPLLFMVATSFKIRSEVITLPPRYIPFVDFQPTLDNYGAGFIRTSELGTINQS